MTEHKWPENHEHVFGQWYPLDRTTIRRQCVHPKCDVIETKKATA